MQVFTPKEIAERAVNKYLGVLVAAKFARHLNELPKERLGERKVKFTTMSLEKLVEGDLTYKMIRRRRSET